MTDGTSNRSPREQQLDALIAEYYLAAEQGQPLTQSKFLAQHSDFSAELREFFADDGRLRSVARSFSANQTRTVAAVGHQIRDYRILNKIGAGGMGTVYLALHMRLEKTVALKILKAEHDANAIARFEREMKAVGKLEHPHIVRALDAGEEAGTHFLAMEYLDGCDLSHLLKTKGRLEVPLACELIRQAALGLQYAHDHNLVHRDVKPSNLMLSTAGQVKVLDLGLAQLQVKVEDTQELTREGQFVGTWLYMAPEQFMPGRQVDSRSDIFSLGVTFYTILVGELPISRGQVASQLPAIGTQRADVPRELQELLGKMLAPIQDERIQTMTEVANVLQAYTTQDPVNIFGNDARRYERTLDFPNSIDATQRFSTTAHDVEVIPPPLPVQPPPIALPVSPVKDWLLKYWRQVSLAGAAAALLMLFAVVMNLPGDPKLSPPPGGDGIVTPPPEKEEGHLNLVLDKTSPDVPAVFAVPKGAQEERILLKPGSNPLPPGAYYLFPDHPDWLLTPEEIVVGIGTTHPVSGKQLPHVAWLFPRLPEQVGAYLEGRGTLWLKGMPDDGLPYVLTLTMQETEVFVDEKGAKIACNWLEVKVIQGDYTETGRLLVDTNEYRSSNSLKVVKGWLTATSSDIKKRLRYLRLPQKNPPLQLAVEFDKSTDAIRDRAKDLDIKIPLMRVSVQDALIMLFGADFYSSSETLRGVRSRLANDGERQGKRELLTGGPKGDLQCWVVKSENPKEEDDRGTSYSYYRHEAVPFSFVKIKADLDDSFRAEFTHTGYGTGRASEATPDDLPACRDLKRDLVNFDESSLPAKDGAKAKYRLTVRRGGKEQVFEVSLRTADASQVGISQRWLEIDVNSKSVEVEFNEQALLSIEDLRDKKGVLAVQSGYLRNQKEVFSFEAGGDREAIELGLLKLGKKSANSLLTVHDVLALMFNAELKASREIGGLRTKVSGLRAERKFAFIDIVLRDLRHLPGEEWKLPTAPGSPPVYLFTRSRELPFDFNTIDFNLPGVFELRCELVEFTAGDEVAPSLLSVTSSELELSAQQTRTRITAAEQDPNWREWRSATPGGWREWAEFGGELKDRTVLLKCKRESKLEVKSISPQSLRPEDREWIAEGRYWNAPDERDFPKRATFVTRGPLRVELKLKTGLKDWIEFEKLSLPDQEWIRELEDRLK